MKVLSLFFVVTSTFAVSPSWAGETPYARTCRLDGGSLWLVSVQSDLDTPLCRFGSAAIGAAAYANYRWSKQETAAVIAYKAQNQSSNADSICENFGANAIQTQDSNSATWSLCEFGDGSVIEANTLARGFNSPANHSLSKNLN